MDGGSIPPISTVTVFALGFKINNLKLSAIMAYIRNHKYHFIYKTTCLITGRYYIGMHSTSNLNDGYLGSGRRLWLSINKHGKANHTIEMIEFLPDRKSLAIRERELVNETLLLDCNCMNLQLGGGGGFISIEHQLKCSAAGGLSNNPTKSRLASERMTKYHTDAKAAGTHLNWQKTYDWTGKSHNVETKSKIGLANSISQLGENNSQFGTKWVYHPTIGAIKVSKSAVESYLTIGYVLGRKSPTN